jgi:hypothetical protein
VAKDAIEADVHVIGISSLAAGHQTLVPQLLEALKRESRQQIEAIDKFLFGIIHCRTRKSWGADDFPCRPRANKKEALQGIEWVILQDHSGGSAADIGFFAVWAAEKSGKMGDGESSEAPTASVG